MNSTGPGDAEGDGGSETEGGAGHDSGKALEDAIGAKRWVIPGGNVPLESTGPEPAMVSHDNVCLLNTGTRLAPVEINLRYADGRKAGPYPITVAARRVRHVRINDLIDPYAPPLGKEFGIVVTSPVPIVVQWSRQETRQASLATCSTMAFGD